MIDISELLDSFKRGEIVIFLYPSISPAYRFLKETIGYCRKKNLELLIVDIFDMLHVYKIQMEYVGIDADVNDKRISVIKEGGKISVGNVLSRISVDEDATLHLRKYAEVFESAIKDKGFVLDITLGFDKLLAFYSESPKDLEVILLAVKDFVGNKKCTAIYFVNQNIVANIPNALDFLEDSATTVIRLEEKDDEWYLKVLKSPKIEVVGTEIRIK